MSHKKDRTRALKGLLFRGGQLVPSEELVGRVGKVISDKGGIIEKLIDNWKGDMRKEIKGQGVSYLADFDIPSRLKENMETIESNYMLKQLALSIKLTEEDVREAMLRTLDEMKKEYGIE